MFDAILAPNHNKKSLRQDELPQDVRDVLAWMFYARLPASDILPIPICAIEIKLDNPMHYLLEGDGGFHRHGGSDSFEYMHHANDDSWAVVFENDCDGNVNRGATIVSKLAGMTDAETDGQESS